MQSKEKKPTWVPEEAAAFWINQASRLLMRRHDDRLRELSFGMSNLPVLLALESSEPMAQKDLAGLARVEQPTMAELLARMERDGVVKRAPNPKDKRGSLTSLTPTARARLPEAKAALTRGELEATAGFTKKEKALLLELLQRVVRNLQATEGP